MIFLWSSAPSECNKSRKSNYETRFDVARDRWSVFFWVNSGRTLNNRNFASHGAAKSTFYCFLNLVHFRPVFEICFFLLKKLTHYLISQKAFRRWWLERLRRFLKFRRFLRWILNRKNDLKFQKRQREFRGDSCRTHFRRFRRRSTKLFWWFY